MQDLLRGYNRFRQTGWPQQRALFATLADKGQSPRALVISCVDSRVDPAMIFDAAPGELLVVRNVANLVPPYAPDSAYHGTSAALEFGVRVLQIPQVIVLGHGQCGGVQALLRGVPPVASDFVGPWMAIARAARQKALQCTDATEQQQCCEQETVKVSLANLMTYPWVRDRVDAGHLKLHGAWFSIYNGQLMVLKEDGCFKVWGDVG